MTAVVRAVAGAPLAQLLFIHGLLVFLILVFIVVVILVFSVHSAHTVVFVSVANVFTVLRAAVTAGLAAVTLLSIFLFLFLLFFLVVVFVVTVTVTVTPAKGVADVIVKGGPTLRSEREGKEAESE